MPYVNLKRTASNAFGQAAGAYYAYNRYKPTPRYNPMARGNMNAITVYKNKKPTSKKSFRGRLLKELQSYHYTHNDLVATTHNAIFTKNVTASVIQGLEIDERQGDQIYLAGLKIRGSYQCPALSGAYTMRLLVGYSGEEYLAANFVTGALGLTTQEIFLPDTTTNWMPNGIVNPKAFTCLYDTTLDTNSLTADTAEVQSFTANINLDKNFPYQAGQSFYGKFKNLYVVLIAAVAGGVAQQVAGSVVIAQDLIFKNK